MEKIIIAGGGGHAKAVITVIKKVSQFEILGYVDESDQGTILGVSYLGNDHKLEEIIQEHPHCNAAQDRVQRAG